MGNYMTIKIKLSPCFFIMSYNFNKYASLYDFFYKLSFDS